MDRGRKDLDMIQVGQRYLQRHNVKSSTPRTASQKMDQFYAALWTYFAPPLTRWRVSRRRMQDHPRVSPRVRQGAARPNAFEG